MKKILFKNKVVAIFCCIIAAASSTRAQSIFIDLLTTTAAPTTTTIAAPTGYSFSGADPVAGTTWNTVGESTLVPAGTTAGTTTTTYSGLSLVDSLGNASAATLTVSYYSTVSTGTRTQPSNGTGENSIQPGGVMGQEWRNYYNGSHNYFTFTFSGLAANSSYKLYMEAGTTTSGQFGVITNITGAGTAILSTANTTANSAGAYGSLWTDAGGGNYTLMAQGTTWNEIDVTTDGSGNLSFQTGNWSGSGAYYGGFQITPVPEPTTFTLAGMGALGLMWMCRRPRR